MKRLLATAILAFNEKALTRAEEASVLAKAQVSDYDTDPGHCLDSNVLINASFSLLYHSTSKDLAGDGSKEITIDLGKPVKVRTVFVQARCIPMPWDLRFGENELWLGGDETFMSTENRRIETGIFSSGFHDFSQLPEGQYLQLRRVKYNSSVDIW